MDTVANREVGFETGQIRIDSLIRNQDISFNLLSSQTDVSETAHLYIVSPGRRLLYEGDNSLRTPPRAELRRDTSDSASRILLQTDGYTTMPGSKERVHSLVAVPDEPGAARRRDHYSVTQANSIVIPYTEPSMDVPPRMELAENDTFQSVQEFFNAKIKAVRDQRDSKTVWLADGEHRAFVDKDDEILIGDGIDPLRYRIKRVMGDVLGETHYVVQRFEVQDVGGTRVIVRNYTVVSNSPEYHGTRYTNYANVLDTSDDPNRGHDCTVEITPFGDTQVIASRASEQEMADEGHIDLSGGTFSIASRDLALKSFTPDDVSSLLVDIETAKPKDQNATPIRPNLLQRWFGKK